MGNKQREQLLRNSCKQLAYITLGFIFCISLLEAKGFVVWAKRLEVGTLQQNVLSFTESIDEGWSAIAGPVTELRPNALNFLTQHGWSDMPIDTSVESIVSDTYTSPNQSDEGGKGDLQTQLQSEIPSVSGESVDEGIVEPDSLQTTDHTSGITEGTQSNAQPEGGQGSSATSTTITPTVTVVQPIDGKLIALPSLKPGQSRHIVFAGDSMMAVGLAPQLQRDLIPFRQTATTAKAYRSATGLARPDVFNWQKEYPLMVAGQKPDVVIVAIGANDTQNMQIDRKVLTIGSDEWKQAYENLLIQYIEMLTRDGAIVLWIKLPPMRPNKYNTNINTVNEVAERVISRYPQVIWWDVSDRFLSSDGKFIEMASLAPGQRQVRIRQTDGIHLTDQGAKLLTNDIVEWLNLHAPVMVVEQQIMESSGQPQ